jgi:hypothetical protein
MKYQNKTTKEIVTYHKLNKEIYKDKSIPKDGTVEILDYHVITPTDRPAYDSATQKLVELDPVDYVQTWELVDLTEEELEAKFKASVPSIISMRQARLALLQSGLLATVTSAVESGTDEELKVEWEYATEVRRDWDNLIAMATSLGLTEKQLDDLFILGGTL